MSQAGVLNTAAGPVPPTVATSYETQNGTAVPAANVLIINAIDSTETNDNGIIAKGGVVGTGTANEVDIVITNRFVGTTTTTDATPDTSISLALGATPGVYTFDIQIAGYDATDDEGVGYAIFGTVRTTGAAATVIGTPDKIVNEEAAPVNLSSCNANLTASGNSAVITLTGIAATTIRWRVLSTFIFVS